MIAWLLTDDAGSESSGLLAASHWTTNQETRSGLRALALFCPLHFPVNIDCVVAVPPGDHRVDHPNQCNLEMSWIWVMWAVHTKLNRIVASLPVAVATLQAESRSCSSLVSIHVVWTSSQTSESSPTSIVERGESLSHDVVTNTCGAQCRLHLVPWRLRLPLGETSRVRNVASA